MKMGTAMENQPAQTGSPKNSVSSSDDLSRIVKSLNGFYDLVGHKPEEVGTIAKMAAYLLTQNASPSMVSAALDRCVKECRYPVRLPDITQRIVGMEVPQVEAEMRAAWDTAIQFCGKYVGCDAEGNYGPEHGMFGPWGGQDEHGNPKHPARYPVLPQRLLDCVRRTGGWIQYKRMTDEDQPFQQKRFFEEYQAWQAVAPIAQEFAALVQPKELKLLAAGKTFGPSKVEQVLPKVSAFIRATEPPPRKDPATEKARLAAWLKEHPGTADWRSVK
jgi:hypothetical protein